MTAGWCNDQGPRGGTETSLTREESTMAEIDMSWTQEEVIVRADDAEERDLSGFEI